MKIMVFKVRRVPREGQTRLQNRFRNAMRILLHFCSINWSKMTPQWRPNGTQNLYKNDANFFTKNNQKVTKNTPKWEHQMEARGGPKNAPGGPRPPPSTAWAPPGHPGPPPGRPGPQNDSQNDQKLTPRAAPDPKTTPEKTKK